MIRSNHIESHTVPQQLVLSRLQEYGVDIFASIGSKSAWKKAIKKKRVWVDGEVATTGTYIRGLEIIELRPSDEKITGRIFNLELEVIYEDDWLAIINKPPGILVSGNSFKTVERALIQNLIRSKEVDTVDPQPIHRLDYATSGLLMIGKTSRSIVTLNKMFELKKIKKNYIAVTIGEMKESGTIDLPVENKEATSIYSVLETVTSERFGYLNLTQLEPLTGRRHQLRQHMSAIDHPILGDIKYGKEELMLKGKGLYLHAYSLEFNHPFLNEIIQVKKELPKKFDKIFNPTCGSDSPMLKST